MKKYRVNVNGTNYEVAVELMDETAAPAAAAAPAAPAPAPAAPAAAPAAGGEAINSPMPGTILSVKVSEGAAVTKGQILMVLEAMKMENEIMSPADGTVTGLAVADGATVTSGQLLCTIR